MATTYSTADVENQTFSTHFNLLMDESIDASNMESQTSNWNTTTHHNLTEVTTGTLKSDEEIDVGPITWDDATWILTSSFIIFTMQSGFGLLEAGSVSTKNEVNIMVKNAADVIFGGITYWLFGYGLSFGEDPGSNWFVGIGKWMVDSGHQDMGLVFSTFIFQLSFATTATTIVSGAMAERTKLRSYMVFSLLNTVVYCVPAHWIWAANGFLFNMRCIDIAGSGGVHLVGGASGLVATVMLGPRLGKYTKDDRVDTTEAGNPTNCMMGMFILWWGWLGFNCGSTFGISNGKWKLASKSAVTTINGSIGGGIAGIVFSYIHKKHYSVPDLVNGVLGGLVSVTGCAVIRPWESIIIGATGGLVVVLSTIFFEKIRVDDPVGAVSVHGMGGIWGMLMVGMFAGDDPIEKTNRGVTGLLHSGSFYLLGVQTLACVCIAAWSGIITFILLYMIKSVLGLRMSTYEELMGADYTEHNIRKINGQTKNQRKDLDNGITAVNSDSLSKNTEQNSNTAPDQTAHSVGSMFGFRGKIYTQDVVRNGTMENGVDTMGTEQSPWRQSPWRQSPTSQSQINTELTRRHSSVAIVNELVDKNGWNRGNCKS